jgi:DNA-binding SARP family transcriptional activator
LVETVWPAGPPAAPEVALRALLSKLRSALGEGTVEGRDGIACLHIRGTELPAAERAGRGLARLAPFRESGHRLLIESLEQQGNLAEALRAYESLRELLRDELGISPSPAMRQLHARLLESA